MMERIHGIQPTVLKWARESQGYSIDDMAEFLGLSPEVIVDWEAGNSTPTYPQLEKLSYKFFKRPLAVFFLPAPPREPDITKEFRTLPELELERLDADTRYQLRLGQAFQLSLKELNDGINPTVTKIFRDIRLTVQDRLETRGATVRDYLNLSMEAQSRWREPERAFKELRRKIESVGIFVFKNSFKQKEISGFCLRDDEFPIIYLNNSTTKTRQIFSLFHELGHLLLNINGISKVDFRYIDALPPRERKIEQFCNAFTAEVLIPSADFDAELEQVDAIDDPLVERLAARYCVSREAVFRKMLDRDLVSKAEYERNARLWANQKEHGSSSGGNYYSTQGTYLGERYLQLVFGKHYQGKLTLDQVADYLGVKTGSVAGLDVFALGKGGPG